MSGEHCIWCERPAEWKTRDGSLRCHLHTPPWRYVDYEPLTIEAQTLKHEAEASALPKAKK